MNNQEQYQEDLVNLLKELRDRAVVEESSVQGMEWYLHRTALYDQCTHTCTFLVCRPNAASLENEKKQKTHQ